MPNLTIVSSKRGLPKIAEIRNLYPLKRFFIENLAWGRESQVCTFMPNLIVLALKNVGLQLQKSRKIAIFGKNLRLKNLRGSQKKLNIGAQLQTFLYAVVKAVRLFTLRLSVCLVACDAVLGR